MANRYLRLNGVNGLIGKYIQKYVIWIALVGFWLFFSVVSDKFFQTSNFIAIFRDASVLGIIACGLTLVMIAGGIDLSVGSLVGISGLVVSLLILQGWQGFLGVFLLSIAVCMGIGFVNGIMITKVKIPALIATLAMMMVLRGVKCIVYGGQEICLKLPLPAWLHFISRKSVESVPISVLIFISVSILSSIILYKTPFGRRVYAVGADSHVAYLMGINPSRVRIITYVFLGALVWLSSSIAVGRIGGYSFTLGDGYEMRAILAVVMGGTAFAGGRGTIKGSIAGVLLMATLNNGLTLIKVPYAWQIVILGIMFILVVGLDSYYHRYRE